MNTENIQTSKNEQNLPTVSIGVPVFNGELFIAHALDSLLQQTYTDFELIISDNCSSDLTEKICRSYATRDKRIKYIRQQSNIGATQNFRFLLDQAAGKYFMWAAADDLWAKNFLEETLSVHYDDMDCGVVFCNFTIHNIESNNRQSVEVSSANTKSKARNLLIRMLDPCASIIYGLHNSAVLRDAIKNGIHFDYWDIHVINLLTIKSKVKIIPKFLYTARVFGRLTESGERIPYSLTGNFMDASSFLNKEKTLFFENLKFFHAVILDIINKLIYYKNKKSHNKIIETSRKIH